MGPSFPSSRSSRRCSSRRRICEAWKNAKFSNPWCYENYLQARAMRRAQDVRKQLVTILDRYKMDVLSAGRDWDLVRRAIVAGYFTNAAKKDPQEGYRTMVEGSPVSIHPSSALFNKNPEWLVELAPRFFKRADAGQLSTAKRRQKIEPLYDRFNPEGSWRLSKRRG